MNLTATPALSYRQMQALTYRAGQYAPPGTEIARGVAETVDWLADLMARHLGDTAGLTGALCARVEEGYAFGRSEHGDGVAAVLSNVKEIIDGDAYTINEIIDYWRDRTPAAR